MQLCAREAALSLLDARPTDRSRIASTLAKFGSAALSFARAGGIRIVVLSKRERYDRRSPALGRLRLDVDSWPSPPAGLFVVEERTVYLRSRSPMTIAHEFGHALDCALGGGVYRSGIDPVVRRLFTGASAFVTPYASTGLDEYFAEGLRAYVEANDPASPWPHATRERLRRLDPGMAHYVSMLFATAFGAAHVTERAALL